MITQAVPAAKDQPVASVSSAISAAPRRPSRRLLRFFDFYLGAYVPQHFNALRVAGGPRFPLDARPLIVVINHPSWWDPLTSILLSRYFLPRVDHYAPIDAAALPKHRILTGMGLFPVEQGTPRGAVHFLRAAAAILSDPNAVLWLTPQGAFTDVRSRPVTFKSGLASLLKRLDQVTVVPLAYEYSFWNEPRPEILTAVGTPLFFRRGAMVGAAGLDAGDAVAEALAHTQDELAALALTRDAERFDTVLGGLSEQGMLRRMLAGLRGGVHPRQYVARQQAEVTRAASSRAPGL